jgi:hypothetical protein
MKYLEDDNPVLWEKVKDHVLDMPDDWEGECDIFCKKCGKKGVMTHFMLWICPELLGIGKEYLHPE